MKKRNIIILVAALLLSVGVGIKIKNKRDKDKIKAQIDNVLIPNAEKEIAKIEEENGNIKDSIDFYIALLQNIQLQIDEESNDDFGGYRDIKRLSFIQSMVDLANVHDVMQKVGKHRFDLTYDTETGHEGPINRYYSYDNSLDEAWYFLYLYGDDPKVQKLLSAKNKQVAKLLSDLRISKDKLSIFYTAAKDLSNAKKELSDLKSKRNLLNKSWYDNRKVRK